MDEKTDFEKLTEGVFQLALVLSQYYRALLENNVPDELAQKLTVSYQSEIIRMTGKRSENDSNT